MTNKGVTRRLMGAAFAASMLILAPAISSAAKSPEPKVKIVKKRGSSIGFFTPAASDPHRAALFGRAGANFGGDDYFRFTPSGGGGRRAVTVAIRARATTKAGAERAAIMVNSNAITAGFQASAYSLGASLGWKHFALAGDVAHIDGGLTAENRDMTDIGLSYSGAKWSTRLLLGTDRATGSKPRIGEPDSMSVDLGGSYALTGNLEVTGGVRYKSQRLELSSDQRRDSQAIYVGTAFRF